MSLVDQIFEQAKLGTAPSPDANPFLAGLQLGQHQQQINMELSQLPLKQTLMQQEAQMNAAKLTDLLQTQQDTINNEQAFQGLSGAVGNAMRSDKPENAEPLIWEAISRNPGLWRHRGMPGLIQDTQRGLEAHLAVQRLKNESKLDAFTPSITTVTDPISGKQFPVIQTGPHASQVMDPEKDALAKEALKLRGQKLGQQLPPDTSLELKSLQKRIDKIDEQLDDTTAFPETVGGLFTAKRPNPKRVELQTKRSALVAQKDALVRKNTPAASETTAPPTQTAPVAVPPSGEQVIVIDKRANSPTFGKRFSIDANDLEKAAKAGYEQE